MTILITILLTIYVLSLYGAYKFIQLSHYHPHGVCKNLSPGPMDLFVVLCPVVNIIVSYDYLRGEWKDYKYRDYNKDRWIAKLFKPRAGDKFTSYRS